MFSYVLILQGTDNLYILQSFLIINCISIDCVSWLCFVCHFQLQSLAKLQLVCRQFAIKFVSL